MCDNFTYFNPVSCLVSCTFSSTWGFDAVLSSPQISSMKGSSTWFCCMKTCRCSILSPRWRRRSADSMTCFFSLSFGNWKMGVWTCFRRFSTRQRLLSGTEPTRQNSGCSVSRFNETEDDWGRLDPQTFGINKDTVVNVHLSRRKTRKSIIWNMLYVIYVRMFCFALKVLLAFSLVLLFWCHVHSTQRMWVQFHLCCSKPPKTQWCVQGNLCELTL